MGVHGIGIRKVVHVMEGGRMANLVLSDIRAYVCSSGWPQAKDSLRLRHTMVVYDRRFLRFLTVSI